jgi:hypothetical protein
MCGRCLRPAAAAGVDENRNLFSAKGSADACTQGQHATYKQTAGGRLQIEAIGARYVFLPSAAGAVAFSDSCLEATQLGFDTWHPAIGLRKNVTWPEATRDTRVQFHGPALACRVPHRKYLFEGERQVSPGCRSSCPAPICCMWVVSAQVLSQHCCSITPTP